VTWLATETSAVLAALGLAILAGMPGLHRELRRRRRALRMCLDCGRTILLGERTCDCETVE
jgi:hypothetical protein